MTWYFLHDGKPVGPMDQVLMRRLQQSGRIGPGTLVWRQGMAQWQPWAQVQLTLATAASDGGTSDTEICCQCGQTCPQGDVMIFGEKPVCAPCKPFFLERIREGVIVSAGTAENAFAGFWIRSVALTLDLLILSLIVHVIRLMSTDVWTRDDWGEAWTGILSWMAYSTVTTTLLSATPGKLVLGLRVIAADGRPMTLGLSVARMFSMLLSAMALGFGFLLAVFDSQRRTLHDGMCDTRVVRNAFVPYKVL